MVERRLRVRFVVFACGAIVASLLATVGSPSSVGARPGPVARDGGSDQPRLPENDLAGISADRWIVQLDSPPLASYRGTTPGLAATSPRATGAVALDASSAASRAYRAHLRGAQDAFEARLGVVAGGARVDRRYSIALNGAAVRMSTAEAARVRQLPGVRAVTPDVPYRRLMFSSPEQMGALALWRRLGGRGEAGRGVKVAIIDSGIYINNACFDDTGYTAPPGYPRGDADFTNNKVIVARSYFRPDFPPLNSEATPSPGPEGDSHGTHVAGTVACNPNTLATVQGTRVRLNGIAPRAFLMNYRVFYKDRSGDDFQSENAYVAELVQAIEDAVTDGADVMSNSWGSTYQNTLAWPDPMVQASEAAVDAGAVMVFAQGNSGPATATGNSPANSPKVIAVGAVSKDTTISPGFVDVTGPAPVPANLTNLDVGAAEFGPDVTTTFGPRRYTAAEDVATDDSPLGCSLANGNNPFPPGSLNNQIAVISRGVCEFSDKVANAQNAGAVAAFVYNSEENGDNLQSMGAGERAGEVTIPSWFLRRSDGLALVAFEDANPTAAARFRPVPHRAENVGDVVAGFSSRGPTQDKALKPDVVAPGVDIISSGYASDVFPDVYEGFGSSSGTSMATPHVSGAAALLLDLHPNWTPEQVKSALMTTATEEVWLDTAETIPAGVLDRGAGRVDLTRAGQPGLTFDKPSISAGEHAAGQSIDTNIVARSVGTNTSTWDVTTTVSDPDLSLSTGRAAFTVARNGQATIPVHVGSTPGADPESYEGSIVLTNRATGARLHIPVWLRVIPTAKTASVLLVDDDGSGFGAGPDYAPFYRDLFDSLSFSYRYLDVNADFFPTLNELFKYRVVVMFTGDNASFDTSGLFPEDQDTLAEWLDSGGRLWAIGQNFAETSDSNSDFGSERFGRARIYHGYLGVRFDRASAFAGAAPRPTGDGHGPLAEMHFDLSPGADGAGNQNSIEATSALGDTDTFAAKDTMVKLVSPRGGRAPASGLAWGRSSEPSLEERRVAFHYRSSLFGFGLEGLNAATGSTSPEEVADRMLRWLLDRLTLTIQAPQPGGQGRTRLSVVGTSTTSTFTSFRWNFGDGTPVRASTGPVIEHQYPPGGRFVLRVEGIDALGHHVVATRVIRT